MQTKLAMRILVYGAGVQGSLYGARLQEAGHDVTLLARGNRLADLRAHGVILEDLASQRRTVTPVRVVDNLTANESYNLVIVAVRREQIGEVLPKLAAATRVPTVLFMHNHAGGSEELVSALGRERIVLGFPGAGGSRAGTVVKYLLIPQQSTRLGDVEGPATQTVQHIAKLLEGAGFPVAISQNMDAWLKIHAVFVVAVCGALYCVDGDNYKLARSTETLTLFADGVREGLHVLRMLHLPPAPLNLRAIFTWMPTEITIAYWRRLFGSAHGQYYFSEHARVAWAEMKMLSDEVREVLGASAARKPSFDRLCSAIDAYASTHMIRT